MLNLLLLYFFSLKIPQKVEKEIVTLHCYLLLAIINPLLPKLFWKDLK